ncbi:MAG: PAS domain-containing protein [Gemmatimonadota bacterium]|nr:MAG: PAS domain-containing protein [Gemmatimonadota bacterium]
MAWLDGCRVRLYKRAVCDGPLGIDVGCFRGVTCVSDRDKTKEELIEELAAARERIEQLELVNKKLRVAEVELATSEIRLQSIVDNTTSVIYLKDLEGYYFTINRQYERLFHVTRQEILGRTDYEIFPKAVADVLHENDKRVIEAREPIEFEEVVPQDDGLHTYISIKFPLRDTAGTIYAVCGISTDITERKRTEHELRRSLDQLQRLEDSEP